MKHGTILRNMWQPSHESLLIYQGVSGDYAKVIWIIDGKVHHEERFYKRDILNDREHYPIVGYVDLDKVIYEVTKAGLFPCYEWMFEEKEN